MSITNFSNTDIKNVINYVYSTTFADGTDTGLDMSIFSTGSVDDITAKRERFTGALIGEIAKRYYINRFENDSNDSYPFFMDSEKFGAIREWISVTYADAIANASQDTITSGSTVLTDEVVATLPSVADRIFENSESWGMALDITGVQWDTAFKDEVSLTGFVNYVVAQWNANVDKHHAELSNINRNGAIVKILSDNTEKAEREVNLVKEYCLWSGKTAGTYTYSSLKKDKEFNRFVMLTLDTIREKFKAYAKNFGATWEYSLSSDRVSEQYNIDFLNNLKFGVVDNYQNVFNTPTVKGVVSWGKYSTPTTIKSLVSNNTTDYTNIVGIMFDKYLCPYTQKNERAFSVYYKRQDVTHFERQFVDASSINLDFKGIVFTVSDYTVE